MTILLVVAIATMSVIVILTAVSQLKGCRGKWGERFVRAILVFLPSEYKVFNDVRVCANGRKCQIDHLVVSPYGIFVIETKNYLGVTSGNVNSAMWQRSVLGKHYKTRSPLLQNQYHIDLLLAKLNQTMNLDSSKIHSIVVFNFANFLRLSGCSDNVVMFYGLMGYIRRFKTETLTNDEVDYICRIIR